MPHYNLAPGQLLSIVRLNAETGLREIGLDKWGLVPAWSKDPASSKSPINARAETVTKTAFFRKAFGSRRCLVPCDGFYEWDKISGSRQPMRICFKDGRLFALAGLWEKWRSLDGSESIESFAIITTEASPLIGPIHPRMPVLITPADYTLWLDPSTPPEQALKLLTPYSGKDLIMYPISRKINNPRYDAPDCIQE
jgi:putative SOS response-associated peptidase YedK